MKKSIMLMGVVIALLANVATASVAYEGGGRLFPNELSKEGLPEAIPCKVNQRPGAADFLLCSWLSIPRDIEEWDPQTQRNIRYSNHMGVQCRNGKCNAKTYKAGFYPDDIWARLSIWYYISESSDGKPVAYLFDTGPGFGGEAVSYREAGNILHQFYQDANVPEDGIVWEMDRHYDGGYATWKSGKIETQEDAGVVVKEARCAPQLDDSCFINGKQVPKAELRNYLPVVQETTVQAAGGFCEYPICYDRNDKPIGIRPY